MKRERHSQQTTSALLSARRERGVHAEAYGRESNELSVYKRAYGQRRPPLIPPNYSGNAFGSAATENDVSSNLTSEESMVLPNESSDLYNGSESAVDISHSDNAGESEDVGERDRRERKEEQKGGIHLPELFHGGIGSEELLILSLLLMISQSGENDILPYLVLLLFS